MARNAALVLGNSGDSSHIGLLELGLSDVGAEVRESCVWALGRFNPSPRIEDLITARLQDQDPKVASSARAALNGEFQ